jgi:hypothetical protein
MSYVLASISCLLVGFLIERLQTQGWEGFFSTSSGVDPGGLAVLAIVLPLMSVVVIFSLIFVLVTPVLIFTYRYGFLKWWQFTVSVAVVFSIFHFIIFAFKQETTPRTGGMSLDAIILLMLGTVTAATIIWAMCLKDNITKHGTQTRRSDIV